ncbi:Signal transduction histidine kinase [Kytococcus aerolatus]|uniref:histidine kinase n=1 Tax=Kytococcus aerolatus TaxID=592308 RepID=A0A212TZX6_9MICO|nr:HAMP domain-containing sensor histidine kinase [Kytococcus aerolatus]SNC71434.1 Signal transduction histidine kinase [Kytococcus aerolatus]
MGSSTLRRLWRRVARELVLRSQLGMLLPLVVATFIGLWATLDLPGPPLWAWLAVPLAVWGGFRLGHLLTEGIADEAVEPVDHTVRALARRIPGMGTGESVTDRPEPSGIVELDELADAVQRRAAKLTALATANRRFAADAAHQLRSPLSALSLRLEEIALAEDLDTVAQELERAHRQVDRLTGVVEEMVEHAGGGVFEDVDVVSLDEVIGSQQREWQPMFAQARRGLRVTGDHGLQVACPRGVLAQVFSTLIENSLRYGEGIMSLEIDGTGPSIQMVFSDEGPGIDPAVSDSLFERDVTLGEGTGRGLALAREVITAAGGRLELLDVRNATFGIFVSEPSARTTTTR